MENNYSKEHLLYLKNQKKRKTKIAALQVGLGVGLFLFWELLAQLGLIDTFIMSSPSRIVATTAELFKGDIFTHVGITLAETVIGFIASTLLGLVFAILLWWSNFWQEVFEPYLVVLNSLPKIALGPVIIIWCGAGMKAIIMMTILICVVVTTITILQAFNLADPDKLLLLRSMGAKRHEVFLKLVFPSSLPTVIAALKINVGLSFVGTIMGEYLVSRAGLGYLIVYGGQVFKLDLVMTSTVILLFLAAVVYFLVSLLERLVIAYM